MSKSLNVGYTDTAHDPAFNVSKTLAPLNFTADFAVKSVNAGECIVVNMTSPSDRPEKIRFGFQEVQDVYKGSGIDPAYYGNSRKGVSIVVQLTETQRVIESTDATYAVDLPISCHLVIKVPNHELITASVVETVLLRLFSSLYGEGLSTTTRINALLHGSMTPPEL